METAQMEKEMREEDGAWRGTLDHAGRWGGAWETQCKFFSGTSIEQAFFNHWRITKHRTSKFLSVKQKWNKHRKSISN